MSAGWLLRAVNGLGIPLVCSCGLLPNKKQPMNSIPTPTKKEKKKKKKKKKKKWSNLNPNFTCPTVD
jgi:hypothetical protein